jgi:hypothetical protein
MTRSAQKTSFPLPTYVNRWFQRLHLFAKIVILTLGLLNCGSGRNLESLEQRDTFFTPREVIRTVVRRDMFCADANLPALGV